MNELVGKRICLGVVVPEIPDQLIKTNESFRQQCIDTTWILEQVNSYASITPASH